MWLSKLFCYKPIQRDWNTWMIEEGRNTFNKCNNSHLDCLYSLDAAWQTIANEAMEGIVESFTVPHPQLAHPIQCQAVSWPDINKHVFPQWKSVIVDVTFYWSRCEIGHVPICHAWGKDIRINLCAEFDLSRLGWCFLWAPLCFCNSCQGSLYAPLHCMFYMNTMTCKDLPQRIRLAYYHTAVMPINKMV